MISTWWKQPSALALLVANLIPLVGVLYFHWSLFAVLLLYWLDTVVTIGFSAARTHYAQLERGFPTGRPTPEWRGRQVRGAVFALGFFCAIHFFFLCVLFGNLELRALGRWMDSVVDYVPELLLRPEMIVAMLACVAGRGFDFYVDYLRPRAYERAYVSDQMWRPAVRVILLQIALLAGGALTVKLGNPLGAILLLVALKTAGDLLLLRSSIRA